jgi:hypothetical protein
MIKMASPNYMMSPGVATDTSPVSPKSINWYLDHRVSLDDSDLASVTCKTHDPVEKDIRSCVYTTLYLIVI